MVRSAAAARRGTLSSLPMGERTLASRALGVRVTGNAHDLGRDRTLLVFGATASASPDTAVERDA